ncbi:type I glutamate--ammonia ligase [Candidatus Woesearchaeota archaeon]|jgi:glutamine synthetase|nr:type I glutamate--ammonia ligase [Candidatus Woesearchaeota archaeon]
MKTKLKTIKSKKIKETSKISKKAIEEKELKEILKRIKDDEVKFIELQFTDVFGAMKAVTLTVEETEGAIKKGKWFDGSSIKGFARICESDMYLKPDMKTYTILHPVKEELKTARFICDIYKPDGTPYEGDPRGILKKVVKEAKDRGYDFMVGPELEFFLLKSDSEGKILPVPNDCGGYFDSSTSDKASEVRKKIMLLMTKMGLTAEVAHHEVAVGQHEIGFRYDCALKMADDVITLKHLIKSVAHSEGLHATFMPKPFFGVNGSGMHVHFSLMEEKKIKVKKTIKGKIKETIEIKSIPAFYDETDKYKLSKTAKYFMAGIMKHIKEMCVLLAPTTSSYKRLVPGYEAPVYVCWGGTNRSALIRIPKPFEGKPKSVRAELRCPDPSASPYLAFAAMLKAGLEGIKKKEKICEATEESVYRYDADTRKLKGIDTLPETLGEAAEEFKKSKLLKEFFGSEFHIKYYEVKKREWDEYKIRVTKWELDRYLESA